MIAVANSGLLSGTDRQAPAACQHPVEFIERALWLVGLLDRQPSGRYRFGVALAGERYHLGAVIDRLGGTGAAERLFEQHSSAAADFQQVVVCCERQGRQRFLEAGEVGQRITLEAAGQPSRRVSCQAVGQPVGDPGPFAGHRLHRASWPACSWRSPGSPPRRCPASRSWRSTPSRGPTRNAPVSARCGLGGNSAEGL